MTLSIKNYPAIAVVLNDRDVFTLEESDIYGADIVELRVDMFEGLENIAKIFKEAREKFNLPILATIRHPLEGGIREIKDRAKIYNEIISLIDFVDIEIFSDEAEKIRKISSSHGKTMIASYHRFDKTPTFEELDEIFLKGKRLEANIVKIATMVNSKDDLETLLLFTLKHKNDKIVTIGMGEKGIPSRIINPIFGSLITYASLKTKSAPGQLLLSDIINIFRILGLR